MQALAALWFVVLVITLCLFAGLLIGGTVFGIIDLGTLLRGLKRAHAERCEDAGDDAVCPSDEGSS